MTKHNMTAEHELLQLLQEECAEVIQAASKCIRFGEKDNHFQLEKELGDLFCMGVKIGFMKTKSLRLC